MSDRFVNKTMLVFLTGPSSVGKTTLLNEWKKRDPLVEVLNADDQAMHFARVIGEEIGKGKRKPMSQEEFKKLAGQMFIKQIVPILNHHPPLKTLVVDDVIRNMPQYLSLVKVPYKVLVVTAPLDRVLQNLRARSGNRNTERPAAGVLDEISSYFEPSGQPSSRSCVTFSKQHVEAFRALYNAHPYSFLGRRLPSTIRRFKRKFFPEDQEVVSVKLSTNLPVKVNACFVHVQTNQTISEIMDFLHDSWVKRRGHTRATDLSRGTGIGNMNSHLSDLD